MKSKIQFIVWYGFTKLHWWLMAYFTSWKNYVRLCECTFINSPCSCWYLNQSHDQHKARRVLVHCSFSLIKQSSTAFFIKLNFEKQSLALNCSKLNCFIWLLNLIYHALYLLHLLFIAWYYPFHIANLFSFLTLFLPAYNLSVLDKYGTDAGLYANTELKSSWYQL